MQSTVRTTSPEDSIRLATELAGKLIPGDIVTIQGDLGAGKSVIARAMAHYLGVLDRITSPTFTIVAEYDGRMPVRHIDLYRITREYEFDMLGLDDLLYDGVGIALIEWPERAPRIIEEAHLQITISVTGESTRTIQYRWSEPR